MKKKLTRSSFSALRETSILLDEREQRAVVGGDYWDDYGVWQIDSSGNSYWTRTSDGDGGGYYGDSGYGTGSGIITQDQFFNWSGDWPGGYVEGMGYVPPDTIIYGDSGYYNGSGYYGGSGYNDSFSINNAIFHLTDNALNSSSGYCAKYIREAIEAGGLSTDGRPGSACDYDTYLLTIGFSVVNSSSYIPQPGDIVVHEATSGHPYGHIAMYNGEQWISDFIQSDMYGGSAYRSNPNYTILRWNQ